MSKTLKRIVLFTLMTGAVATPALAQQKTDSEVLMEAIRGESGTTASRLINDQPALVNSRDLKGDTPLTVVIARGDREWTGYLLNKGADVDLPNRAGETPLMLATRIGFNEAVGWLVDLGAKVDLTNKLGETALIVAVQQRNESAAKLLLKGGADPNRGDYSGHSARDYAKRDNRSTKMIDLIDAAAKKPEKTEN